MGKAKRKAATRATATATRATAKATRGARPAALRVGMPPKLAGKAPARSGTPGKAPAKRAGKPPARSAGPKKPAGNTPARSAGPKKPAGNAPAKRSGRPPASGPKKPAGNAPATAASRDVTGSPAGATAAGAAQRAAPPAGAKPIRAQPRAAARAGTAKRAAKPARNRPALEAKPASAAGAVVRLLDAAEPVAALREMLAGIAGPIDLQHGQIVLGAAQLMLLPIAREHRGGREVKELLDLVLSRWGELPDRTGFHAQELLRNAFAAVGEDRDRLGQLVALVPADASAELRFNIACAYAVVGDRPAMLRAVEDALVAGASPEAVRRDPDFERYRDDHELRALLERSTPPPIPLDIGSHITSVRMAIDTLVKTLRELGETVKLEPPASVDAIAAAERARRIQLPNDYRALLTITDGMTLWDHQFLGTHDYRTDTKLARSARDYLELSARYGATGIEDCVPLANWGQPNDWLLYDPYGRYRNGEPGVVLMLNADEVPLAGVVAALERFEEIAKDVLGTN